MSQTTINTSDGYQFKKALTLWDCVFLVAGNMIGSGIFIVSADITRHVGSAGWLLFVWLIGAVMTLAAALAYGELSGMFPKAGGEYVYLKEAYNPLVSFLFGWSLFAVIHSGNIAAVAVSFFKFLAYIFPFFSEDHILLKMGIFHLSAAQLGAVFLILFLTYVNTLGIKNGRGIQRIFTVAKLLCIFILLLFGFYYFNDKVFAANWQDAWHLQKILPDGKTKQYSSIFQLGGAIASGLVGAIISYDAWNNITFVAGEVKNPKRNIGLGLFIGTLLVAVLYLALNFVFTIQLPLQNIANAPKDRVGIAAAEAIFNHGGTLFIVILLLIASFGCENGMVLSGPRVYYTMARDNVFPKRIGILNRNGVPAKALWSQAVIASLLCLSGRYGDLLDMISFVVVIFYILTILGVFILRKKMPDHPRTYRAFGYPFLPALYIFLAVAFCSLLLIYKPAYTVFGLCIASLGLPLYYWKKRINKHINR